MSMMQTHGRAEWSDTIGEWIVVYGNIGFRYYFDCKAEAEEYIRLRTRLGGSGELWRTLGVWCVQHKHDYQCLPHWQRGKHGNAN